MDPSLIIRPAEPGDLTEIGEIYAHYVINTVATFEETPPDESTWRDRLSAARAGGLPFLIAERAGALAGYAYCAPWKSRPAYRFTVEDSVYLAPDAVGCGLGGRLLDALLAECAAAGIREVIAVIADSSARDGATSVALHEKRGFVETGRLTAVGFKFGRWLDTVLLQRSLTSAAPTDR